MFTVVNVIDRAAALTSRKGTTSKCVQPDCDAVRTDFDRLYSCCFELLKGMQVVGVCGSRGVRRLYMAVLRKEERWKN